MGSTLFVCTLSLLGGFSLPAFGQTTSSSIAGTIADPSGAVIPNAKITIRNEATGQLSSATADAHGGYTITNLPPGTYKVSATASGFQPVTQNNVIVDPNIGRQVNFTLHPGSASTTITVQANANVLQTQSASVGQLVTRQQVKSIALNGRNPIYLSQLEPGVTRNAPLTSFNFTPDFSGPQISGARNDSIAVTLDGAPMIRTRGNGTTTGVADVDTVSQMQILSTTYPAEYGGTDGGVLAQIPRFGTQDFHGSAYEYLRNSFFDANTWIRKQSTDPTTADHPTPFRFNQFGWVFSGPVAIPHAWQSYRNKLFFLVAQEYLRYRQTPTQTGVVPTTLMRTGNFSELLGPNIFSAPTQIVNPYTGAAYPDNVITTGLSPNGLALLNAFPAPNQTAAAYTGRIRRRIRKTSARTPSLSTICPRRSSSSASLSCTTPTTRTIPFPVTSIARRRSGTGRTKSASCITRGRSIPPPSTTSRSPVPRTTSPSATTNPAGFTIARSMASTSPTCSRRHRS